MESEKSKIQLNLSELQKRLHNLSATDKNYIENIYLQIFRRKIKNCGCAEIDKYGDAINDISIYLKKNKIMKKSDYTLKNGVVLRNPKIKDVVTNANITNELAEEYLKENQKYINQFAAFPPDWKNRIKNDIDTSSNDEKSKTVGRPKKEEISI